MGVLEAIFLAQLTLKLNVCLDEILDELEFGSPRVIN